MAELAEAGYVQRDEAGHESVDATDADDAEETEDAEDDSDPADDESVDDTETADADDDIYDVIDDLLSDLKKTKRELGKLKKQSNGNNKKLRLKKNSQIDSLEQELASLRAELDGGNESAAEEKLPKSEDDSTERDAEITKLRNDLYKEKRSGLSQKIKLALESANVVKSGLDTVTKMFLDAQESDGVTLEEFLEDLKEEQDFFFEKETKRVSTGKTRRSKAVSTTQKSQKVAPRSTSKADRETHVKSLRKKYGINARF